MRGKIPRIRRTTLKVPVYPRSKVKQGCRRNSQIVVHVVEPVCSSELAPTLHPLRYGL